MPRFACIPSPWLLLAILMLNLVHPIMAHASGGGGDDGSSDDDDTDDDDDEPLKKTRRGKAPSHFEIKPSAKFALRHAFDPNFSLDVFVRGEATALDNPLSLRSSLLGGGVETTYKVGLTTWFVKYETKEVFSQFYQHATRTDYNLQTSLQHQINLGASAFAVTPRVLVRYQWSDDAQQERWKFETIAPLSYKLSDTIVLLPLLPKLSYQTYTHRTDNRADWTLTISTGVRWYFVPSSFVETTFGFENRWSNVPNSEYSRWKLVPQLNLRVPF